MLDAITLDLGCVSAPAFILPDASGLAPLELPSALVSDTPLPADGASREPLPDAVRRFEAAMGAGEAISDAVPVSRLRAVVVPHEEKRQVVVDTVDPRVDATAQKVVETVDSRVVVMTRRDAIVPENPVNSVDPVVKDAPQVVVDVQKPDTPSPKVDVVTGKETPTVVTETVDSREVAEARRVITETVDSRGVMEAWRDAIAPDNSVNTVNPVVKDAPQVVVDVQKPDTPNPKVEAIIGKVIPAAVTEAIDSRETVDSLGVVNTQRDVTAPENPVNSVNPVVKDAPQAVADVPKSDAPSPKADVSTGKEVPAVVTETVDQRGVVMTRKDTPQAIVDVQRPDAPSPKVDVVTGKVIPTVVTEAVDSRGVAETRRDKVSPDNSVKPVVKDAPDAADQRKVAETVVIVPVSTDAPAPQAAQATPDVSAVSAATARTESIVETVNQIVEAVAGQILVTPGIAHGEGEVKIMLKPTVLDGSEITMSSKGGTLTVNIAPATPDAAAAAAAALPRLETALAEHAPAFHHVTVALATKKGSRNEAV